MAHDVTANKYRPQTFDDLIGQEFVAATLKNSISNNKIANAYLLSGPRGVGKTSAARIIAKALNCEQGPKGTPCQTCDNCVSITQGNNNDVLEIDGASNTSINDIRSIQEEILYPPVNCRFKVYIIDEVHMLSKSAFNALLKTIEEPPEYVVFVFATTEVNKVLPTIRSRCQQFNFRLIPSDDIFQALVKILKEKNVPFEDNAVIWIANEGKGSMRDSYTLLDQVLSFCQDELTLQKIQKKLGLVGEEKMSSLIHGVIENNREQMFTEYFSMIESGITGDQIITEMIEFFRNILIIKSNVSYNKFIGFNPDLYDTQLVESFTFDDLENILEILFKTYENIRTSMDVQTEVEICLLKLLKYKYFIRPKQVLLDLQALQKSLLNNSQVQVNYSKQNENIEPHKVINQNNTNHSEEKSSLKVVPTKSEILKIVKSKMASSNFQLFTALNNIKYIEENENHMVLFFDHKMHFDIVRSYEEELTQAAIAIIGKDHNNNFRIKAVLDEKQVENPNQNLTIVKDIFQGKEV